MRSAHHEPSRLLEFLSDPNLGVKEASGGLEEFVSRSMASNIGVRGWCREIAAAMNAVRYILQNATLFYPPHRERLRRS